MKNIFKDLFKKKDKVDNSSQPISTTPSNDSKKKSNFLDKIKSKFQSLAGKSAAKGEDVIGVELHTNEIRLSQVSSSKDNRWIVDKFYLHKLALPENTSVLDNPDLVSNELQLALQKSKIKVKNAAFAIPVTSAIIRVVTSPLMKDDELVKAIDTDSLWENLVQLTENLEEYSIFYQIIERHPKENTMDILFVASKLSDINKYTEIIKKADLNPVIVDVKCFAIKAAVDQINQISGTIEDSNLTAILEFGLDENYVMILHENNPIITDIFIRSQDRKTLTESSDQEEIDSFVRRYVTQVKQAINDFETRYEKRIRNLRVVSDLENVETYLAVFRKNLVNTGFNLLDPFDGLQVPEQIKENLNPKNKSNLSTIIGLAFRKLDVFGYYKFVTAVKNINLLPNRDAVRQQNKIKFLSGFAFKGAVGAIAGIYLILTVFSFFQISNNKEKLLEFDQVQMEFDKNNIQFSKLAKKRNEMQRALDLGQLVNSNQARSYRSLAQVTRSVPQRVQFTKMTFDGKDNLIIEGVAFSDQDILNFISNLNAKSLIEQASLAAMKNQTGDQASGNNNKKGFTINCKLKLI